MGKLNYIEISLQQCGRFMKYDVNVLLAPHAISILSMFYEIKNIKYDMRKIITNKKNVETALIICSLKLGFIFFSNFFDISKISLLLFFANLSLKSKYLDK